MENGEVCLNQAVQAASIVTARAIRCDSPFKMARAPGAEQPSRARGPPASCPRPQLSRTKDGFPRSLAADQILLAPVAGPPETCRRSHRVPANDEA